MKNFNKRVLRDMILEQVEELFVNADGEGATRLEKDSVDDQIDSFILKFERDSAVNEEEIESMSLNESFESMSLKVLLEQEDEDAEEEEAPEAADAEPEAEEADAEVEDPEPVTSAATNAEIAESLPKIPLDIDAFTKRVARLAMNYENLLDVKTTIVNRAMNFLQENYDEVHVREMKDILDAQFDFDLDGGKDIPAAPYAAGAWAGGTGGLGGGGGV